MTLKELRESKGKSVQDASSFLGMREETYRKKENDPGKFKAEQFILLSDFLDLSEKEMRSIASSILEREQKGNN